MWSGCSAVLTLPGDENRDANCRMAVQPVSTAIVASKAWAEKNPAKLFAIMQLPVANINERHYARQQSLRRRYSGPLMDGSKLAAVRWLGE